ncbi:MAG: aminodeoxychorismate synthase, component [Pseudomonadota bacterium]|jgi:para-aminobenzoate synthetase component 1
MSISLLKTPLPYFNDSSLLFSAIADLPWAIFLDSAYPYSQQGRYDILAAEPLVTLITSGELTTITTATQQSISTINPFQLVKQELAKFKMDSLIDELPFHGGAIGYFAYDLARRLEKLPQLAIDAEQIPDMAIGIYPWVVIVDHQQQSTYLIGLDLIQDQWDLLIEKFSQIQSTIARQPFQILSQPKANFSAIEYETAFNKIKYYLTEGDCYQINLTQRFCSDCQGHPWLAYQRLRQLNPAPFSAYCHLPNLQILSSSPERFLKIEQGQVETKPIKGTRKRMADSIMDQQQILSLMHSLKDRAENLMIVDLLRNDLSKNCDIGSVKVPKLFAIESYATVHHLVSTICGQLTNSQQGIDLLQNCFPGGSITGAPKIRAMEIIEELEPHRRGIYCGSIGYIDFNGNIDTNIAIRTFIHSQNTIRFWAGGGIVYDSICTEEYQESFDKAAALLKLLREFRV